MGIEKYHYTACGLTNIFLENGYALEPDLLNSTDNWLSIEKIHELHASIACSLALQGQPLISGELRYLRRQLDMSQNELAHWLGYTEAEYEQWENDTTPPRVVDAVVRKLAAEKEELAISLTEIFERIDSNNNSDSFVMIFKLIDNSWSISAS